MPETSTTPKRVPMRGAHLRLTEGEEPALEGCRCPQCGDVFYPPRSICLNCYHEGLDSIALSRRGTLYTFTIARMSLPGALVTAPYVIAQVKLPEGVIIPTVLTGIDPESVQIGLELELVVEKASVNAEGAEVMTFKFRPA
ncbi:MAG: OB-fold domain-containing protein [Dehalococcoidia bacterium]|nr:OB-fold domain-containing protein [Dehalococcoidia bacterium]